jgi:hypothetical protein
MRKDDSDSHAITEKKTIYSRRRLLFFRPTFGARGDFLTDTFSPSGLGRKSAVCFRTQEERVSHFGRLNLSFAFKDRYIIPIHGGGWDDSRTSHLKLPLGEVVRAQYK